MRIRSAVLFLLLSCALLSACNLNSPGATGTRSASCTPTAAADLATPTSPAATSTPAPATPTFPPVITATPPPATATPAASATSAPELKIDVIKMTNANSGWAVGQFVSNTTDDILKTADGGNTWKSVTPPEPNRAGKHALAFFQDANHAWVNYSSLPNGAPPTQLTVWRTTDGGAS